MLAKDRYFESLRQQHARYTEVEYRWAVAYGAIAATVVLTMITRWSRRRPAGR